MQSKIDNYLDNNSKTPLEHTLSPTNRCTQLGDVVSVTFASEEGNLHSIEELHGSKNNLSVSKPETQTIGLNKMSSISTTCSFKGTGECSSMVWDEIQYLKLLNSFQADGCTDENSLTPSSDPKEEFNNDKTENFTSNSSDETYNQITKFSNKKVVFKNNKLGLSLNENSPSSKSFDEFTSVCEALSSYTTSTSSKNKTVKLDSSLCSKVFKKDLKLAQNLINKQTNRKYTNNYLASRLNKGTLSPTNIYSDSDSSSTIMSTTSENESSYMDKVSELDDKFKKDLKTNRWINNTQMKHMKKLRKTHLLMRPDPPPTSLDKYMSTLNNYNKNNENNVSGSNKYQKKDDKNKENNNINNTQDKTKELEKVQERLLKKDTEWRPRLNRECGEVELKNVLETLDKMGGVKYEPGSVDLRRNYKSFEQLCFGLGCIVAPTRQELEMCSQLSQLGDESTLSHYETSVYQSCLLRTRSFESIWTKFCNKSIGIIRKYILQGIYRLLSLIEFQNLVEPFLKVILLDLGTDRQDQQLFLNIVQEEMNQLIKNKYILLKLTSTKSISLDDIIEQMYIQLYRMALLSSTKTINFEGSTSFTNLRNGVPDLATKLENVKPETVEENLLEKLFKLYQKNFENYELVVILDKLTPRVNDLLYLLQMLNTRKVLPIKCFMIVCTNNEQLERYCNSRIYSNLGIFDCNIINVPSVIDEILQVVMYDTNVQDFLPNFIMLNEIYELFYYQDSSLTLFILRIYQLYEQYYNKYIYSYLTSVPLFVFDDAASQNTQENFMGLGKYQLVNVCDSNNLNLTRDSTNTDSLSKDPNRDPSGVNDIQLNTEDKTNKNDKVKKDKNQSEQLMLPKESFTSDNNEFCSPKISEISTTTSLRSLAIMTGFDTTPSDGTGDNPVCLSSDIKEEDNNMEHNIEGDNEDKDKDSNSDDKDKQLENKKEKAVKGKQSKKEDMNVKPIRYSKRIKEKLEMNNKRKVEKQNEIEEGKKVYKKDKGDGKEGSQDKKTIEIIKIDNTEDNNNSNNCYNNKDKKKNSIEIILDDNNYDVSEFNEKIMRNAMGYNMEHNIEGDNEDNNNLWNNINNDMRYTDKNTEDKTNKNDKGKKDKNTEQNSKKMRYNKIILERDTKQNVERLDKAKRLYSIYSLLCISNNMSENHVAYMELKLGMELDLEKIVLELLPLNSLILLQRRVLFQLGMNLLYKLMVFTPDSYNIRKRLKNLISSLPTFNARYDFKIKDERDKPLKELIKRTLKYLLLRSTNPTHLELLKTIISGFNNVYCSSIQVVINIQTFLNWNNYSNYENQDLLKEMYYMLDENMEPSNLATCIKSKLFMCFFPFINTYKLANLLMLQGYTMTFRNEGDPIGYNANNYIQNNKKGRQKKEERNPYEVEGKELRETYNQDTKETISNSGSEISNSENMEQVMKTYIGQGQELGIELNQMLGEGININLGQNNNFGKDTNYLMYIYRFVKYKMINMWKLFIIYYYLVTTTSNTNESWGDKELVEIYIRFNINIELFEKIYKIILLNPATNSTISSKETQVLLNDKSLEDDDIQLCYLIKNSLSNINVKFM